MEHQLLMNAWWRSSRVTPLPSAAGKGNKLGPAGMAKVWIFQAFDDLGKSANYSGLTHHFI